VYNKNDAIYFSVSRINKELNKMSSNAIYNLNLYVFGMEPKLIFVNKPRFDFH